MTVQLSDTHVLVVDDEKFMRDLVRRLLGKIGVAEISEATDGLDGFAKLEVAQPDLIVLDIMMKPMNGLKFLKSVRLGLTKAPAHVPVIVVTGSDEQSVFGTAMALDCNAFVRKGRGLGLLKDKMARVLTETPVEENVDSYKSVIIPDITIASQPTEPPPEAAPKHTKAFNIPIEEVEPGAIVAQDMFTESGSMLLSEGTVLNEPYLNRLKDLSEIINLPSIWVEM